MFQAGQQIGPNGRFWLERRLGQGSFGVTFLARDTLMDGPCVVKLLRHGRLEDMGLSPEEAEELLRREAQRLSFVKHPQVPAFLGMHEVHDVAGKRRFILSQQYIEGQSLRELLGQRGRLPVPEATQWLASGLEILSHLHGMCFE